ncbi:MAG: DUF6077 domain-containing protein [Clostridium sp.]|nr:DUF6077 domain-containing protein [Clostridium sp.]
MRTLGQVLVLGIWLLLVPAAAGKITVGGGKGADATFALAREEWKRLPFYWVSGQTLLWAAFQLLCVPLILKRGEFSQVAGIFQLIGGVAALLGLGVFLKRQLAACRAAGGPRKKLADFFRAAGGLRKRSTSFADIFLRKRAAGSAEKEGGRSGWYWGAWAVFWALLVFQAVQAVRMTYADGDDTYYVAVAALAEESDTMYVKLPYTGGSTGLDVRHGLAPFPLWIAFLARISGMRTVSVAHVALPCVLIPMAYAVYAMIGGRLCGTGHQERLPVFLVFTEILVLFGDYSIYSVENFLIARTRQGKAVLGSIVIPLLFFLLLALLERLAAQGRALGKEKVGVRLWLLLAAAVLTGCLCSTMGALLCCLLIGLAGLWAAVCYRKWKFLIPMALSCAPAIGYALLYLRLG